MKKRERAGARSATSGRNFLRSEKLSLKLANPDMVHEKIEGRGPSARAVTLARNAALQEGE